MKTPGRGGVDLHMGDGRPGCLLMVYEIMRLRSRRGGLLAPGIFKYKVFRHAKTSCANQIPSPHAATTKKDNRCTRLISLGCIVLHLLHHCLPLHGLLALLVINNIGIYALCLRDEEKRHDGAEDVASEEDPERVGGADLLVGEPVEKNTRQNGTEFTDGSRDAVSEPANSRGEDLARKNEGGGAGAEVEEQLQ